MRQSTKREVVAKKLRNSPAAKRQGQSPKRVVKAVQDELVALLARGYSIEEVGRVMRGAGIEISATTLKSYAQTANVSAPTAATAKRRASEPPPASTTKRKAATKRKTTTKSIPPAPATRSKSVPPSASKSRAGSTKSPAPATGSFHDYGHLGKATFVVRPDTPDTDL